MEVKFDQHLLNSKNTLLLEATLSDIKKEDIIFEIGPADGRLSRFLLQKKPKKLISIEMDENFKEKLEELKNDYDNFEYLFADGLIEIKKHKFNKLVSNIPYSITEPLYIKLLEIKTPYVVLLHGIGFYEQILNENSKWHYFVNSFYDVELINHIAGNAFSPPAKTMSVLLLLKLKEKTTKNDIFFQNLFSKSKRNTKNALQYTLVDTFEMTKKEAKEIIDKLELSNRCQDKNLENLSNEEFIKIITKIKDIKTNGLIDLEIKR